MVIDWSFARIDPATVAAAGFTGVIRYLGGDARLTAGERDAIRAAGLDLALVWETRADRASAGFAAGAYDGDLAEAEADMLGYPPGCAIYYAVDFNARDDLPGVFAYFDGVASVARRPVGCYGGDNVFVSLLARGVITYAWQAAATSWSEVHPSPFAHVVQLVGETVDLGGAYDRNTVQNPAWGQWSARPPAPTPDLGRLPVKIIVLDDAGNPGQTWYHPSTYVLFQAEGAKDSGWPTIEMELDYFETVVAGPVEAALAALTGGAPDATPPNEVNTNELADAVVDELADRLDDDRPKVWTSDSKPLEYADDDTPAPTPQEA